MADDAYYRQVVAQMQSEFTRAVAALEKQVATLTRHNALLSRELAQTKQQQSDWAQEATQTVTQLQHQLKRQAADAATAQGLAADKEAALQLELTALKTLLHQEQDYWTRVDDAGKQERDRVIHQVAQAKAETKHELEQNKVLRREIKALERRVETAVATSHSFEQRLVTVVHEQHERAQHIETQLLQYKKKVQEKRAQNKYLTDALVRLQEQRQSPAKSQDKSIIASTSGSSGSNIVSAVKALEGPPAQRRRKRELTLPEEIKAATTAVATASGYTSKPLGVSRTRTSPTSSSPELSPRLARRTPYQRAPSIATTTPTTIDGVSVHSHSSSSSSSSSSRSRRSGRRLQNVTLRRRAGRSSSDSDHVTTTRTPGTSPVDATSATTRLERELSGLRRKLDSCIADAAARW